MKIQFMMALIAALPCCADTILYSNLGAGNTFIVNQDFQTNFDFMATSFVTTGSGNLSDILTPIFSLDAVSLGLYTDSSGEPGTLLESWNASVPGFPGVLGTITSVDHPFLSSGTPYWFTISLTAAQKDKLAWYENDQGLSGGIWLGTKVHALLDFTPDTAAPAIRLDATSAAPVPEPAVGLLTSAGFFLLVLSHRMMSGRFNA